MEKQVFYQRLNEFERGTIVSLAWNRGNGKIERLLRYEGFDEKKVPMLYFVGETRLNFDLIGGYNSIISIQEECPDGACCH